MAGANTTGVRAWCDFSLPQEFVVEAGVNDLLVLTVDGTDYNLELDPGTYITSHDRFTSTLINQINQQIAMTGAPVEAKVGGIHDDEPRTVLVFEHTAKGDNTKTIAPTGGTAIPDIIGDVSNVFDEEAHLTPAIADLRSKAVFRQSSFSEVTSKVTGRSANRNSMDSSIGVRLQGQSIKSSKLTVRKTP
ncbi:hypothetical protein SP15_279 [Bacillus phage SP-15]|uniref:Uncharacterized protein n=1 Tax=Bacillus phage SP-15 TaxID=1792032 RepID=A0A127AWV9_9CAUD|nr:hypothetical protein SP15_279 [Bacillus phage SP-15]AMM45087.1 hypothetical protein SP15_279 [Bacillus phage SP-15]